MKIVLKLIFIKLLLVFNFYNSSMSYADSHNIYETLETIKNDLIHLESQYKDTYKSNDNDLNKVMLDYIAVLIEFTTFIKDKYKNTEYTTENPEYPWENEILSIDSNDSRNSIAGKLDDAIEQYGILRNYNVGPLAQSLTKFQDDLSQPTFMHYMKKLLLPFHLGMSILTKNL